MPPVQPQFDRGANILRMVRKSGPNFPWSLENWQMNQTGHSDTETLNCPDKITKAAEEIYGARDRQEFEESTGDGSLSSMSGRERPI